MAVPVHSNHGVLAVTSGLTSLSFTLPSGSGDLLIFHVIKENTASITKPAAATQKSQVAISDPEQQTIFYGLVSALGAGPYGFSWTGSTFAGGSVHRISGAVASGDPFNAFDHQFSNVNSTATPATSVTTTSPDCLLIFFGMGISGSSVWTPPASFTEIFESSNQTGDRLDQANAGSSGSLTADSGNSDHKAAFLGAVLPLAPASFAAPWTFPAPGRIGPSGQAVAWAGTDPGGAPAAPAADADVPYTISQYGGFY